jgi:hydrogenase-4 component F
MIFLGLLSMAIAAIFMVRQRDIKRMLAYSSTEQMGILILGIGIGGSAIYGSLLHLINNGLTKSSLFLSAGNIHRAFGSKTTDHVRGAFQRVPITSALFLAGFFAIMGSPPFGPFVSEFTIVKYTIESGQFITASLFLLMLGIIFIGMGVTVLEVVQGNAPDDKPTQTFHDSVGTNLPIILFMALVLLLGLYIPPSLESLLREAAALLEAKR